MIIPEDIVEELLDIADEEVNGSGRFFIETSGKVKKRLFFNQNGKIDKIKSTVLGDPIGVVFNERTNDVVIMSEYNDVIYILHLNREQQQT